MATIDDDEEYDSDEAPEMSPEQAELQETTRKEVAKFRRQAIINGVSVITQGTCQDIFYAILNFVSAALVAAQLVLNLYSTFMGGSGCKSSGDFGVAEAWFYSQLVANGVATVGQLYVWIYSAVYTMKFCCCSDHTSGKFPNSQFASSSDYKATYMSMKVQEKIKDYEESEALEFQSLDQDEQHECYKQFQDEIEEEVGTNVPLEFTKNMKGLAFAASLQGYLTTFRAIIGALGTILEPSLAASGAWEAYKKTQAAAGSTARLLSETSNAEKCLALRQMSTAGSGIIAAVGIQQERIRSAFTKLVLMSNLRQKKIDALAKRGGTARDLEKYDVAIEKEVLDAVGPQGKKMIQLVSGKPDV